MAHADLDLASLERCKPIRVELDGTGVVVVRTDNGIHAYEDVCPHAGWRLSEGEIVGGLLECPGHGWQFDPETGECADVPAYRLKRVAVSCVGEKVRVTVEGGD